MSVEITDHFCRFERTDIIQADRVERSKQLHRGATDNRIQDTQGASNHHGCLLSYIVCFTFNI